ncbi:MAG: hypothetical protein K0S47_2490 [Herbinix sp.]|jgi:stage V sporulation protein AB|nr:hypothetical protein [Herbinix sp.]
MNNILSSILLFFTGISAGVIISGGLFAFITMIGVVTRLVSRTKTAKSEKFYEDVVILGATMGNLMYVYELRIPLGVVGLILFGVFPGIYVGCLAVALAETAQTIPIFANRVKLKVGMPIIVLSMALGKCLGALYQLFL